MSMRLKGFGPGTRVLVVGLGLMGGSYARALSRLGCTVTAVTKKRSDLEFAVKEGFLAGGVTEPTAATFREADLIILALYPHTLLDFAARYARDFAPGTLVTDLTGVKGFVVDKVQALMPPGVEFIAAHPMAGREKSGVRNSDDAIFHGANYLVVPTEKNTREAVRLCEELGRALGFARFRTLSVAEHDRMVAFLSQLTHCIAVALMCACEEPGLEAYTGDSFRDLTRIARINDEMWSELFLCNREALLLEMDRFEAAFDALRQTLLTGDREKMREMMRLSTARRAKFEKPKAEKPDLTGEKSDPCADKTEKRSN